MTLSTDRIDYRELLQQAYVELQKSRTQVQELRSQQTEPIAIVGMSCRFPGGADRPDAYWKLLKEGKSGIKEIPSDRWDVDAYYDADVNAPGKMYVRSGGFIDNVDTFDPQFFGISEREAAGIDPQQRLLLEVAWEALENAGQTLDKASSKETGTFIGSFMDDYLRLNAGNQKQIDAYNSLGTLRCMTAGRLAYLLNLQGPTMQLDTACSSSLVAIHLACQSLRAKECNMALAGGVNLMLSPDVTIGLCKLRALATDGRCKTFDATADGYVRGEGCGVIVLKRLSSALADGDNILALIRGSAINHDGASNGLTAPNGVAQEAVVRKALANAGVQPSEIQYVETHGTGTSLGDPIEVLALGKVLGAGRTNEQPLNIGSVKTNFGHLESAAGIASLMKVVLSLQNQQIPPHLHLHDPNPYIPWQKLPLQVPQQLTSWEAREGTRLAGVSSFGMSGTNVHLILEQGEN
jgi:acyl transferase domain-containing protein